MRCFTHFLRLATRRLFPCALSALLVGTSVPSTRDSTSLLAAAEPTPRPSEIKTDLPRFQITAPFTLELVAAAPLLQRPASLCWDERGRLFVCDSAPASVIRTLEDVDHDGRFDRATAWAEQLGSARGVLPVRGGLLVTGGSEILFLTDQDQDGIAEKRVPLLTGFKEASSDTQFASPTADDEGWIHLSGATGETITGPQLAQPVQLPQGDFRFRPDGSALETTHTDSRGRGLAWNTARDLFVASPNTIADSVGPLRIPSPAADRLPSPASPESSPPFPSLRSPFIYPDDALPGLRDHLLICDPVKQQILRRQLIREGASYRLEPVASDAAEGFVVAASGDFHPIAIHLAPDGSVWIIDTGDNQRQIAPPDSPTPPMATYTGRLWRLAMRDFPRQAASSDLSRLTVEQLSAEVVGANAWRRETAARLIVERRATASMDMLARAVRDARDARAVLAALSTLDQLDSLNSELLEETLKDTDPVVRRHALRLCQTVVDKRPGLLDVVLGMTDDPDPRVRIQVAIALGGTRSVRALPALAKLARSDGRSPIMRAAIQRSCVGAEQELRAILLKTPEAIGQAAPVLDAIER